MAIVRLDPFRFPKVFTRWPSFFDEEDWPEATMTEGFDVYEEGDNVIVKAAVPGVPAEKVEVTFEDGVLRVKAHTKETKEEKDKKKVVYRQDRVASFDYTTTLPRAVDADKISAEVDNGVVSVKAPIAPEARPKQISVKTKKK